MMFAMRPDLALSELLRKVKSDSSKWIHRKWLKRRAFHWQRGYDGFTVSRSGVEQVGDYIRHQDRHHRRMTFQEEFKKLLDAHEIEYDERYIWL